MDVTRTGITEVLATCKVARVAPGSAKVVPKYGTNVEAVQQFPSYSQQNVFNAVSQLITLTNVVFPAGVKLEIVFESQSNS